MGHYDTLGVQRDATADEIKAAFRRAASAAHPDRGGDADTMKAVNQAYGVLSDPARRAQYDETGGSEEPSTPEEFARRMLRELFQQAVASSKDGELLRDVGRELDSARREAADFQKEAAKKVAKLRKRRDAITTKEGAENIVHQIIDHEVADLNQRMTQADMVQKAATLAAGMLKGYSSAEIVQVKTPSGTSTHGWGQPPDLADLIRSMHPGAFHRFGG